MLPDAADVGAAANYDADVMALYKSGDALNPEQRKRARLRRKISEDPDVENDAGLTPSLLPRKHAKPVAGGSTTYEYRDPEKRRAYQREYQRRRRAAKAALRRMTTDD